MADPVLRSRGLTYPYPGAAVPALEGVDLEVQPGEMVVLAGPSASGKTTLLRAACGLVPHFHGGEVSGELEVAGLDVRDHGPAELAAVVGFVAQEPETQVVSTTVQAEVELPLELRGADPAVRARAVEEVALALGIADLLERSTDTLSGGELQRVALAAALVTRPRIVLLDEPTSQLDPVAGDELIGLLRRLNEEWGVAVLLASTASSAASAPPTGSSRSNAGAIAFDGAPAAFLAWALDESPSQATPAARLLGEAGLPPAASVREARRAVADLDFPSGRRPEPASTPSRAARPGRRAPPRGPRALGRARRGRREHDALRGLSLQVEPGERVALMGRNGAGKSTLLRAAAGLIEAERGRISAPRRGRAPAPALGRPDGPRAGVPGAAGRGGARRAGAGRPRRGRRVGSQGPLGRGARSAWRWRWSWRAGVRPTAIRRERSCSTSRRAAWTAGARPTSPSWCGGSPTRAPPW